MTNQLSKAVFHKHTIIYADNIALFNTGQGFSEVEI